MFIYRSHLAKYKFSVTMMVFNGGATAQLSTTLYAVVHTCIKFRVIKDFPFSAIPVSVVILVCHLADRRHKISKLSVKWGINTNIHQVEL